MEGVEPPTAWFVARYSIQLSYMRSFNSYLTTFALRLNMVRVEGFEPPTTWFVARYSIQLSYGRFALRETVILAKPHALSTAPQTL